MRNNFFQQANRVGLFLIGLFIICFIWYFIRPVEQVLHLNLLKLAFIGFNDMNVSGFVLGLVQSYIGGYIGVALWWLSNSLHFKK